jgi:hypothetical protein
MTQLFLLLVLSVLVAAGTAYSYPHCRRCAVFLRLIALACPILMSVAIDELTELDYHWNYGTTIAFYGVLFVIAWVRKET